MKFVDYIFDFIYALIIGCCVSIHKYDVAALFFVIFLSHKTDVLKR